MVNGGGRLQNGFLLLLSPKHYENALYRWWGPRCDPVPDGSTVYTVRSLSTEETVDVRK